MKAIKLCTRKFLWLYERKMKKWKWTRSGLFIIASMPLTFFRFCLSLTPATFLYFFLFQFYLPSYLLSFIPISQIMNQKFFFRGFPLKLPSITRTLRVMCFHHKSLLTFGIFQGYILVRDSSFHVLDLLSTPRGVIFTGFSYDKFVILIIIR